MGSDMFLNPPVKSTKVEWVDDDLVIYTRWDNQKWSEVARFQNPGEETLKALKLSYNVPLKHPTGYVLVESWEVVGADCTVCMWGGGISVPASDRKKVAALRREAKAHAKTHGDWCKVVDEA